MKKSTRKNISQLEYFGIIKIDDITLVPEGMYLIDRENEGTWLMSLNQMNYGNFIQIGLLDLLEVICVANKSCLGTLKKEEFYETLNKMFNIDFTDKLYATQDVSDVFSRVASYTKRKLFM